jgi:hypothetical protein
VAMAVVGWVMVPLHCRCHVVVVVVAIHGWPWPWLVGTWVMVLLHCHCHVSGSHGGGGCTWVAMAMVGWVMVPCRHHIVVAVPCHHHCCVMLWWLYAGGWCDCEKHSATRKSRRRLGVGEWGPSHISSEGNVENNEHENAPIVGVSVLDLSC